MKKMPLRSVFALIALTCLAPLHAAEPAAPENPSELIQSYAFQTARTSDGKVLVTWKLPRTDIHGVDVFRHTKWTSTGRVRLAYISRTTEFLDAISDTKATYWYWLKVTFEDRSTLNVGPVISEPAEVWVP